MNDSTILDVLSTLNIDKTGYYDDKKYIIELADSNEYAKYYSILSEKAVNLEYPEINTNTNDNAQKITSYFEFEADELTWKISLVADFEENIYYMEFKK